MRIASSSIELAARTTSARTLERTEQVRAWVGDAPGAPAAAPPAATPSAGSSSPGAGAGSDPGAGASGLTSRDEIDLLILLKTFRLGAATLAGGVEVARSYAEARSGAPAPAARAPAPGEAAGPLRQGWGVEVEVAERTTVQERVDFAARGTVTTADGRALDLRLALSLARVEVAEASASLRAGDRRAVDPIALALQGGPVAVAGRQAFDLDADGREESVAGLAPGSAWLARDLDGNGRVTDGRELFGPATGSGFGELRALDIDRNGWLDEADPAFASLRLWEPAGGARLSTLGERGVGALYLGAAATPIALADAAAPGSAPAALLAETGIFLREDGTAGALQHVDLVA